MDKKENLNHVKEYLLNMQKNNKDFVIDGDMKEIDGIELKSIMDIDFDDDLDNELLYVHATDYTPSITNSIVCTESTGRTVSGRTFGQHASHRLTVHGTLNTLVEANMGGSWDSRKYTVLIPFSKINSKIAGLGAGDTFYIDKVELNEDTVILVPENEKDNLHPEDLKYNIIFYKGNYSKAVSQAVAMLGYKPQTYKESAIANYENVKKIESYRLDHGYGKSWHYHTMYKRVEDALSFRDVIISEIRDQNINTCEDKYATFDEIMAIINQKIRKVFNREEQIFELLTLYGIAFDEFDNPYFLNTHETLDRLAKYYNQEVNKFIVKNDNIKEYPEVANLYNTYVRIIKEKELGKMQYHELVKLSLELDNMEKENATGNSVEPPMGDMTKEQLLQNEVVKDFRATLKSLFEGTDFNFRILAEGVAITYPNEDRLRAKIPFKQMFPDCEQWSYWKGAMDNIYFSFDRNKSLTENLKYQYGKIVEVYKALLKNNYLSVPEQPEETNGNNQTKSM